MTFLQRVSWCALTACSLLLSASAIAQSGTLEESLEGEARSAYDTAVRLFDAGDYAGSLIKFTRAHELSHDPRLLWNMAVCEKEQHHYANAALYIQRHLSDSKELTSEQRADAEQALAAFDSLFSQVWISNAPTGARIVVDETFRTKAPLSEPLRLDVGSHTIQVSKTGYRSFSRQLEVTGNGKLVVDATLAAIPLADVKGESAQLEVATASKTDLVSIDGKVVGSHTWRGPLPPGKHTVRVTGPGKVTYEANVDLTARSTRTLHVTLEDEQSFPWYWLAGGTALAVAGVGGYLLLRSEEPEGPTGMLTTVYLP